MKTVSYIAICDKEDAPGVYGKITGYLKGFTGNNFVSNLVVIEPSGIGAYKKLIFSLLAASEEIVLTRYLVYLSFVYPFIALIYRFRGQKLVLDVPTPLINLLKENLSVNGFTLKFLLLFIFVMVLSPLSYLFSSLVLEYSYESKFLSMFSRKQRLLVGNCVDISVQVFPEKLHVDKGILRFISVGTIAPWHGWDKMIMALGHYHRSNPDLKIKYDIIGEGPSKQYLSELITHHELDDHVRLLGYVPFEQLSVRYQSYDLGIGSLGWERVGISLAAPIKSREYLAFGLTTVFATPDTDFCGADHGVIELNHGCSVEELLSFLKGLDFSDICSPLECHNLVKKRCSFDAGVRKILRFIDYENA